MNVKELRERLSELPDWMDVHVESNDFTAPVDEVRETGGVVQISADLDFDVWEGWE